MKTYTLQSSFNNGVLDPTMRARFDTDQYYQGCEQGDNVKFLPQGGARRRPGLDFYQELPGKARIIPLVINSDSWYILAFTDLLVTVYNKMGVQVGATVAMPYPANKLFDVDFAQSGESLLMVHEDYQPLILSNDAGQFIKTDVTFIEQPQFDFTDAQSPTGTDEIQQITFSNVNTNANYKLTLEGIDTEELVYEANSANNVANIKAALVDLINTPDTGIEVVFNTPVYQVTFSGAAAKDWRTIAGRRVDAGTGAISATSTQDGSPQSEDSWSSVRGWPRTVTFHEGRLWFGGSKQRPTTMWGSYVNSFFNFGFGRSRDDQGIEYTLNTDQNNRINAIYSSRTLQIFTAGGEFTLVQNEFDPITPSNVRILAQTHYGAKKVKPVDIEGVVTFVQRTGKAIREMFTESQGMAQVYTAPSISYLAPSLINNPVQLETLRGTSAEDANYIIAINSDGTCATFNTLRDQNVAAWSRWITQGSFTSVATAFDDLWFVVKRRIGEVNKYYLEKANPTKYTDSTISTISSGSAQPAGVRAGYDHLEGKEVRIRLDGQVQNSQTVSSGNITFDRSWNYLEVGLEYSVIIKTMPIAQNAGGGFNLDDEKRITRCTLELFESLGVEVDNVRLPDRKIGDPMGQAPTPFTGRKVTAILGWSKIRQVTIKQSDPVPMTLLGLGLEVDG